MGILAEKMLSEDYHDQVVADVSDMVERRVAAVRGASGMVVRGAFKAFKAAKPGILPVAVAALLPDLVLVLDRYWEEFENQGRPGDFTSWLSARSDEVAEDLLRQTDAIVASSKKGAVKKTYSGIRRFGKKNVAEAVPDMAGVISKYMEQGIA